MTNAVARPLRIAMMLESDGPGGAEYVLIQLSEELRRRGHTVIPVGPARGVGWLDRVCREKGFETEKFTLNRPIDPSCLNGMIAMLRRQQIDLVHSHEFTMAVYGAAAARVIRKPYVITMHGAEHHTRAWRRRVALRWAFGKSRATVAVSDDTRKHLETVLRLPHGSVTTVRNGIPVRPGSPDRVRAELGMQPGELLVVAVGNLVVRKGHRVLLEALHQLSANGTGCWRLAVAGRGRLKESLQQLAAEQGIGDRVHFLGHRDDVPDLLAAADIFAMPSLWEGLPLAVLESMFAGKPIVASAVSGIPEAVTSGEEGLLTAPGDTEALAAALRQLLEDSALRDRLGRAARARAEAEFTVARMADQYERLYADKPKYG